jgi:hypothetical protein
VQDWHSHSYVISHLLLPYRSVDRTQSCSPKVVKTLHPNLLYCFRSPCKACMVAPYLQIFKQLYIPLFLFVCQQRREVAAPQGAPYALWLVKRKASRSKGKARCAVDIEVCLIVDGKLEAVNLKSLLSRQQRGALRLRVYAATHTHTHHTHTHTHHTHTHTTHTHTLSLSHSLTLWHTLTHSHTLSLSLTLWHTLTHSHTLSLSLSVAFSPQANYTDWATASCRRS